MLFGKMDSDRRLTRNEFNKIVFERDNYKCVVCQNQAVDVHHIIDRKLFQDGGYYQDNGVSLCSECHIKSERGEISCKTLRQLTNIQKVILPGDLDQKLEYDKWGNTQLPKYIKYPKIPHLPWSKTVNSDDIQIKDHPFRNKNVVITEKLDGENTTLYNDHIHARSLDSKHHWTQTWVKNLQGQIAHEIPENYKICGENLYATHSIKYTNLETYFFVFGIWRDDIYISWDELEEFCTLLQLKTVPVFYRGLFSDQIIKTLHKNLDFSDTEGYTIRLESEFKYANFQNCIAKFVRKNHVQTSDHWKYSNIEINELMQNEGKEKENPKN